jgi:hypothetical protein
MKRVLTILAILLLPLSVWAMTPVNDSDLSNVTGQAGVNINADITMNMTIGVMAWGDSDGITGVYMPWATAATGGYIGMSGFNITNLRIRARYETSDNYNSYSTTLLKPITIDVATAPVGGYATAGGNGTILAGTSFVRFGLGALHISMAALSFDVSLGTHAAANYIGATPLINQDLGSVNIGGLEMFISPWSYVDIYNSKASPSTTQGVTFGFNFILDRLAIPYMSWGDADGLGVGVSSGAGLGAAPGFKWISSGNTAGYIGLNNFTIGDATAPAVVVTGAVAIDILTDGSALSTYAALPPLMSYLKSAMKISGLNPTSYAQVCAFIAAQGIPTGTPLYVLLAAHTLSPVPVSVVHISFPVNFDMTVQKMWADVQIASTANLGGQVAGGGANPGVGELGDIYISGLHLQITSGSWVDIWAH